jgi:hypothetical protein
MGRHRIVLAISITFTAAAAVLWGFSLDDGSQVSRIIIGGAQASAVIAVILWVTLWAVLARERGEQRRADTDASTSLLIRTAIRTLGAAVVPPRPLRPTLPLHRTIPFHRVPRPE